MSFKCVGAAFFAIALTLTLLYPSGKLDRRLLWLGSCALMITKLVYLRLLLIDDPFGTLRKSLYQEVTWMVTGHKGIGTAVPNWDCLERLHFDLSLHGLLFLALGIPFFKRLYHVDVILIAYALVYLAVLTMIPKYSECYVFPVILFVWACSWPISSRSQKYATP